MAVSHKINFGGHPVPGFEIAPLVGCNLPTDAAGLTATIREVLLALPGRDELLRGAPAEITLPGLSQAAAVLLAEWHGQYGNWPEIRWAVRGAAGFTWPEEARCNLNELREAARTAR